MWISGIKDADGLSEGMVSGNKVYKTTQISAVLCIIGDETPVKNRQKSWHRKDNISIIDNNCPIIIKDNEVSCKPDPQIKF